MVPIVRAKIKRSDLINELLTWQNQGCKMWESRQISDKSSLYMNTMQGANILKTYLEQSERERGAEDRGMAVMATTSTSLTCALVPRKGGLSLAAPGLEWKHKLGIGFTEHVLMMFDEMLVRKSAGTSFEKHIRKRRHCTKKAGAAIVTSKFELKPPPYPLNALEPHMSKDTLEYHWGKHHRAYVDNLNKQIVGTELDEMSLEDVVIVTYNKGDMLPAFNNAAQAWNHEFFWGCMKPGGGGRPSGELLQLIERDFGSFEQFVNEFKSAAATQFGSGWAWLVYKANRLDVENAVNPRPSDQDKKIVVVKSPNAVNPLVWDYYPLLTIDVWEHAYYLDFQNRRPDYISTFIEKLVSWEAVSARLEVAKAQAVEREKEEERRRREEEKKTPGSEAVEMYVDSENDDSEAD